MSKKGILVARAVVEAKNGLDRVTRTLEERKVLRMSTITPGYRDAATKELMVLDVSLDAVMNPGWKPQPLDPNKQTAGQDPSRYMLDIGPFDMVRLVNRDE